MKQWYMKLSKNKRGIVHLITLFFFIISMICIGTLGKDTENILTYLLTIIFMISAVLEVIFLVYEFKMKKNVPDNPVNNTFEEKEKSDVVMRMASIGIEKALAVVTYEKINLTKRTLSSLRKKFIAFDTETTGLSAAYDRIIELGAVVFEEGKETTHFSSLVNPDVLIPASATQVNHITNEMIAKAPREEEIYKKFSLFFEEVLSGKVIMCAHNASFDVKFIANTLMRMGYSGHIKYVDTLGLSRKYIKTTPNHKQPTIAHYFNIINVNEHRASDDALTCGKILLKLMEMAEVEFSQFQK